MWFGHNCGGYVAYGMWRVSLGAVTVVCPNRVTIVPLTKHVCPAIPSPFGLPCVFGV